MSNKARLHDRFETRNTVCLSRVEEARAFLRGYFAPTPLVAACHLSARVGGQIYLKLESSLPTGSFKPRGALFALKARLDEKPCREVVAASTGNHGAAVAYAARQLGVAATIFLPNNPNARKRARIADLGANIIEAGRDLTEAAIAAASFATAQNAYLLDDASDPAVPIGAATIACELFDQLPAVQRIYVPVGDTALIRGIASVSKQRSTPPAIVGVQAEQAPAYFNSWRAGSARPSNRCNTIADGLATKRPLANNVAALSELVDDMLLVSEAELLHAIRALWNEERVESEPAGAASTAALLKARGAAGEAVVCIVSGCNISDELRQWRALRSNEATTMLEQ